MNNQNKKKPNFNPKGGIGSTWKDPKTGDSWRFTQRGWEQDSVESIQEDIESKDTFQDIKNEDDDLFVTTARKSGLSDVQIAKSLVKKKEYIQSGGRTDIVYNDFGEPVSSTEGEDIESEKISTDVFGGMSKQEVLRQAFESGITKNSTLKNIADTYDLVMGTGDKTKEEIRQEDFTKAQQFITDNPDATKEELLVAIRQYTNLDATDANALIGNSGALSKNDIGDLTDDDMRSIARGLVKDNTGLFTDSNKGKEQAISEVENDPELTHGQKTRILELINEEYPKGRGLLAKLLPGGK